MTKSFTAKGIDIQTNVKVLGIENKGSHARISLEGGKTMEADLCLVSVGRKIYTDGLHLEKAGLKLAEKGFIETDDRMENRGQGGSMRSAM